MGDIVKMWLQFSFLCVMSISIFSSFTSAQDLAVTNAVSLSDADVFREGVPFKLTCSADMVNVPLEINIITSVQIKRQIPGSSTMEIAFWKPNNQFGGPIQRQNTMSRSWSIEFSGSPPVTGEATYSNRAMKAELTMNDVKCSDAGVYECVVVYDNAEGVSTILSGQQNISSQASIQAFRVWVDPSNLGFQYKDGDNVMMYCYAEGPENLQMSWRYSAPLTPSVFRPYFSVNNDPPELLANSECGAMKYRSSFNLTLQEEENGYMYVCAVRHGNEMEHTRNITLSISAADVGGGGNTLGAATGGSSGSDAGMIVGIVIGVLAFIVIVLLIVYFCWYRKRNQSPKDKDTENDDTKPDMHAPPPVFYSKPNKPPKDDRDDGTWGKQSDASDTWGRKPRYDTYDDDRHDDYDGRKPSSSSTGRQRGRQGSSSSAVRDRDAYPSRSAYDDDNGYGPESKNDSYDSYSRPRYEKRRSRDVLSPQAPANTTTDVSGRSEDEASDAPLSGSYGQRPRPKRRTSRPSSTSEDRDDRRGAYKRGDREREREMEREGERGGDPALHYAQLDLAPSGEREKGRSGRGGRRDQPVEYAEIRV